MLRGERWKPSCVTCHDPHRNVQKSVAINEGKCLSCHANRDVTEITTSGSKRPSVPDLKPDFSHSLKPAKPAKTICPVNPKRGCLGCHMPSTRQKESHSIKTDHFIRVPRAVHFGRVIDDRPDAVGGVTSWKRQGVRR